MAQIELIDFAMIGEQFICPIEYGDYSALNDNEISEVENWVKYYKNCIFDYDRETLFKTCEITGQFGLCVKVEIYKDTSNV